MTHERLSEILHEQRRTAIDLRNGCPFDSVYWNWFDAQRQVIDELLMVAWREAHPAKAAA